MHPSVARYAFRLARCARSWWCLHGNVLPTSLSSAALGCDVVRRVRSGVRNTLAACCRPSARRRRASWCRTHGLHRCIVTWKAACCWGGGYARRESAYPFAPGVAWRPRRVGDSAGFRLRHAGRRRCRRGGGGTCSWRFICGRRPHRSVADVIPMPRLAQQCVPTIQSSTQGG